jgi:ketosteroid isomerase-like protein
MSIRRPRTLGYRVTFAALMTCLLWMTGACATTTFNPYHAVVRSKILNAFRGLTNHDAAPALAIMAEDVQYTFEGEHALGGTRVTRRGVERWFGRLFRLLPGPFVIRSVEVTGWPWSTRVVTTFEHQVSPPEGGATGALPYRRSKCVGAPPSGFGRVSSIWIGW